MAARKKKLQVKVVNKWNAPLSRRPYVTLAILAVLVCALALTIELIQDVQVRALRARMQPPAYSIFR